MTASRFWIILSAIFLLFSSCQPRVIGSGPEPTDSGIEKLLILPFRNISGTYGEDASYRSPFCGNFFITGKVESGAEDFMTHRLLLLLEKRRHYLLIRAEHPEMDTDPVQAAVEAGRRVGADLVLVGHVYRFTERAGTGYAIESPAAVAFDLNLVRVSGGKTVWCRHFDEVQRSLSENLLNIGAFIKRKGRWITAEEMSSGALEEVIEASLKP